MCRYTLYHRRAFLKLEKYHRGHNTLSGYMHDIDKVLLYPILGVKWTSRIHSKLASHHISSMRKTDFFLAVIDWESSRLTKKDKQLNAYYVMKKKYPEYEDKIAPILVELGID